MRHGGKVKEVREKETRGWGTRREGRSDRVDNRDIEEIHDAQPKYLRNEIKMDREGGTREKDRFSIELRKGNEKERKSETRQDKRGGK